MSAVARASSADPHPRETDDPRNRLLDAFEAQVEAMLANGLEPQLRARLARLLPARGADAGGHVKRPDNAPENADDLRLLCLSHRSACREHARRMRTPSSAKQFTSMADTFSTLAAWLEPQKGETDA